MKKNGQITEILSRHRAGDAKAIHELFPLVYESLKQMAKAQLRRERGGHTLQPSALVNEAFLRLSELNGISWSDRAHFFAMAATCMRRILVDYARGRGAIKRGGEMVRVAFDDRLAVSESDLVEILALDQALVELAEKDARMARIVELRFFGGLTAEQIADVLQCSAETIGKEWRRAKVFLYRALNRA